MKSIQASQAQVMITMKWNYQDSTLADSTKSTKAATEDTQKFKDLFLF